MDNIDYDKAVLIENIIYASQYLEESLRLPKDDARKVLSQMELLIRRKYMIFNSEHYHVAMLDNLWSMFPGKKKENFCKRMLFYCDIMNAYNGKPVLGARPLIISLKNKEGDVTPMFTVLRNGDICELGK